MTRWFHAGAASRGWTMARIRPGLPVGVEDFPEEHAQRVTRHRRRDGQRHGRGHRSAGGKSTTLMTLITTAALMYRPERVTFYCIGASLYPVENLPHVAGVVGVSDIEGVPARWPPSGRSSGPARASFNATRWTSRSSGSAASVWPVGTATTPTSVTCSW